MKMNWSFLVLWMIFALCSLGCTSPVRGKLIDTQLRNESRAIHGQEVVIKKQPTVMDREMEVEYQGTVTHRFEEKKIWQLVKGNFVVGQEQDPWTPKVESKRMPLPFTVKRVQFNNSPVSAEYYRFAGNTLTLDIGKIVSLHSTGDMELSIFMVHGGHEKKWSSSLKTLALQLREVDYWKSKLDVAPNSPYFQFKLGDAYIQAGEKKQGIALCESGFSRLGLEYDRNIYLSMGKMYGDAEKFDEAATIHEKIFAREGDVSSGILSAFYWKKAGKESNAFSLYEKVLDVDPKNREASFEMGTWHEGQKKYAMAGAWYRRVLHFHPGYEPAVSGLKRMNDHFLRQNSGSPDTLYGPKGKEYGSKLKTLQSQIADLKKKNAQHKNRVYVEQHNQKVNEYNRLMGEAKRFESDYKKIADTWNQAIERFKKNAWQDCIESCDRCLQLDPKLGEMHSQKASAKNNLAADFFDQGNLQKALDLLLEALDLEGREKIWENGKEKESPIFKNLGVVYWKLGQKQSAQSPERISLWKRALLFNPGNPTYLAGAKTGATSFESYAQAMGKVSESQKKYEKTLQETAEPLEENRDNLKDVFEKNASGDQGRAIAAFNQGNESLKRNQIKEAMPKFEESIAAYPFAESKHQLAYCHILSNLELTHAEEMLYNAIELYRKKECIMAGRQEKGIEVETGKCYVLLSVIYGQYYDDEQKKTERDEQKMAHWIDKGIGVLQIAMKLDPGNAEYIKRMDTFKNALANLQSK